MNDVALERGLPANLDAEKFILGSVILDGTKVLEILGQMTAEDFILEKHRRIFSTMAELNGRDVQVDRITIAEELMRRGELEFAGGFAYVASLDEGLPQISNLDGYIRIVREKASLRRIAISAQHVMNRALIAEESADEIIDSAIHGMLGIGSSAKREWSQPADVIAEYPGGWQAFASPAADGVQSGIGFPWSRVQEVCCGMHEGELVIVAGRPSMGKSAIAMQMGIHAAQRGYGVAYVSLEMTAAALVRRQLAQHGRIDSSRMKLGYLNSEERRRLVSARSAIEGLPFWLDASQRRGRSAAAIVGSVRHLIARVSKTIELRGWLVIVDHMHLVDGTERDERIKFSRIIDTFQRAGRDLGCVMMVLAQLSRKCEEEGREPGMTDLKETSNVEQNADLAMFVHRPEMYVKFRGREDLRGHAKLIIGKQRDGAVGFVDLTFLHSQTRFESLADEYSSEPVASQAVQA